GVSLFWGIMIYFLLKEMLNKLFNGYTSKLELVIEELKEIKKELNEIKEELKDLEFTKEGVKR
ncbi:MAG: hypothetical protein ACPL1F_00305, partial [bacterium]